MTSIVLHTLLQIQLTLCCCLVAKSYLTVLLIVAHQAPLSMGFPRQEYWSGLPFPSPGDIPDPGIEPSSSLSQEDSLPRELSFLTLYNCSKVFQGSYLVSEQLRSPDM